MKITMRANTPEDFREQMLIYLSKRRHGLRNRSPMIDGVKNSAVHAAKIVQLEELIDFFREIVIEPKEQVK